MQDKEYQESLTGVKNGEKSKNRKFSQVWGDIHSEQGLLLKGHKLILPEGTIKGIDLKEIIMDIAHEGHPGATKMKQYLRSKLWFPHMDQKIEDVTRGYLACQAATATKHRDPLVPTEPPSEVWKDLTADHWGPTPNGKYVLAVIDKLRKFPEVEIVSSTTAEPNIRALDNIFSRL